MKTLSLRLVAVLTALFLGLALQAPAQAAAPKKEVKKAATKFIKSVANQNAKQFCSVMPNSYHQMVASIGTTCEPFIEEQVFPHFTAKERKQAKRTKVVGVKVKGKKATVKLRNGKKTEKSQMIREGGKWKIAMDPASL